jgi:hypothetical protein
MNTKSGNDNKGYPDRILCRSGVRLMIRSSRLGGLCPRGIQLMHGLLCCRGRDVMCIVERGVSK